MLRPEVCPMLSVPRLSRRWLRFVLAAVLLLGAYTAAGFWLVPRLVANGLRDTLSERYQRSVQLGEVRFNPFSFELELRSFAVPDADARPLLSFDRLYLNLGVAGSLRGGPSFQAIALDKPHVRLVRRADGALNLADFASSADEPDDGNKAPPQLWIDDLAIRDGRATIVDLDRPRALTVELGPISLAVRKFSTRSDGNEYTLAVQAAHGERLEWRGDFGLSPLASHGKFSLSNLQLQTLAEIGGDSVPFQVTGGSLAAQGGYAFAGRGQDMQLSVDVSELLLQAIGVRIRGEDEDAVALPRLVVSNIALDARAHSVTVEKVLLEQLHVAAVRDAAGQLNLNRLMPAADVQPTAAQVAAAPQPQAAALPAAQPDTESQLQAATAQPPAADPQSQAAPAEPPAADPQPQAAPAEQAAAEPQRAADPQPQAAAQPAAEPQPQAANPTPADPPSDAWHVSAPKIELRSADIRVDDHSAAQPANFHLAPLDLTVGGFTSPLATPLDLELSTGVNESGRFATQGQLDVDTLSGRFSIDATAIPLPAAQPYLDEVVGFNLVSGNAFAQGTLSVSAAQALSFEGEAGIDDLRTTDKELEEDFVKWAGLKLTGLNVQTQPLSVRIADIAVTEPYARVIISASGATNLQDALTAHGGAQHAAAADEPAPVETKQPLVGRAPPPPATELPVEIDMVRIADGSLSFADRSLKPNFDIGIQKLAGQIKGLSARPDARADVQLEGQVDRYTPVKITGKVNYFAAVTYTDLRMAFRNLELTSFSPYSGKFAGYRIERGKLKVNLNYLVKKRRLEAKHKIIVDQLQLGAAVDSPDATSLPVKLAVALLKDRNGVIDLDIPVSGNLDDPKFRVWPIIGQVVLNLLTKIVTSPFALLGSLFGAGEEISYLDLSPATAVLSPNAQNKLQTLRRALVERPALNLDLPLVVKPSVDGPVLLELRWQEQRERLARRKLGAQAKDAAVARLLATAQDYRALLEADYLDTFKKKPQYPQPKAAAAVPPPSAAKAPATIPDAEAVRWLEQQLKARITIAQADFDELARERAQRVQAVILDGTGIDPARVFVITADPLAADAPLRMQLALH
jgi:hypothetical protein